MTYGLEMVAQTMQEAELEVEILGFFLGLTRKNRIRNDYSCACVGQHGDKVWTCAENMWIRDLCSAF